MLTEHNTHLSFYPHKEGIWREKGWIVGSHPRIYPKLFKFCAGQILTWKDGINDG